ncbi:uncharacterized protein MELLADRAFT_54775 [Melampsora larici-populina 98AG31]|uniref:Uncharacterized protein n=1 Tax=Melampsora larici-populina (strain 98AG31 / pathotype 3-4-7) TaxID=747676 RepID=F4R602_MELLP|nr:uncharacterized protein MELLADRAFT_54775 [Melampsora larici-populina 98AG31]EGG12166.1 hypothetical protein MELLADRAFT_54775 [Melampsora larici-populina 98AG31]
MTSIALICKVVDSRKKAEGAELGNALKRADREEKWCRSTASYVSGKTRKTNTIALSSAKGAINLVNNEAEVAVGWGKNV